MSSNFNLMVMEHIIKFYPVGNADCTLVKLDNGRTIIIDCCFREVANDKDGNPIWRCNVTLESIPKTFTAESVSKKEVKQEAALQLLKYFVETEVEESEEWETPIFYAGSARFW